MFHDLCPSPLPFSLSSLVYRMYLYFGAQFAKLEKIYKIQGEILLFSYQDPQNPTENGTLSI